MESLDILEPLARSLTPADMPNDDLIWIAENCGMDAAIKIILTYSGMPIYVPKRASRALKISYLRKGYTGGNIRELCSKLNISQSTAFRWLRGTEGLDDKTEQIDMFPSA